MRVAVRFPGSPKRYCYSAPEGTRKGDVVLTPPGWTRSYADYGRVVGRFPNYQGRVKRVLAVFREESL